jgi:hypothetical protein
VRQDGDKPTANLYNRIVNQSENVQTSFSSVKERADDQGIGGGRLWRQA